MDKIPQDKILSDAQQGQHSRLLADKTPVLPLIVALTLLCKVP